MAFRLAGIVVLLFASVAGAEAPARKTKPSCLFDGKTLKGWKIAGEYDFKEHGKVFVRKGRIVLEKGRPLTGIRWTGRFPSVDYEVSLDAMRIEGDDFFCSMVFPIGKSHCSITFGGWGGSIVGLTNIDGEPAVENETCVDTEFKNNRWYHIRLRVTGEKVEVWLDKEKLVDFAHKNHKLDIRWEQEPLLPLGISSYRTTAAVRNIAVRPAGRAAPPTR